MRMDDNLGSFHNLEYLEMPQTNHSLRANKVLARSRNTVSLSALTKEETLFHKEMVAALGNDWPSNVNLTSSERFNGFVDNLCRSRSSPAVCWHQKPSTSQPTDNAIIQLSHQVNSNATWNRLDEWTKMIFMAIIISIFITLMQSFG
ncbi:uncharacterized protein [Halyomorpha halys]|uniref:uncharacterized protein n=1 Tax=Halyomorpha halys TaxID=286706 RepID=UPI0006D51BC1|nr:uncharacterized protein LOC106689315 [Halyomorpha halys]